MTRFCTCTIRVQVPSPTVSSFNTAPQPLLKKIRGTQHEDTLGCNCSQPLEQAKAYRQTSGWDLVDEQPSGPSNKQ